MNQAITDVTHAMQTAVAPVFLILGAGTLLNSMATRYGRILDRARLLLEQEARDHRELVVLLRRARLLRKTIFLDASSIFCTALTIFVIFGTVLSDLNVPYVVPTLFAISLLLLIASLACFIEDFAISLRVLEAQMQAEGL